MPANIYKNKAGKRVPGVTTIISGNLGWNKQQLMHWANAQGLDGKSHREVAEKAADIGTVAHKMVELEITGQKFDWPQLGMDMGLDSDGIKKAQLAFSAFVEWRELVNFELLHAEHLLVSEELQVGGQIDIAAVQNKTAIVDIKTSNDVYADHKIQIAAYGALWNEHYPDNPIEAYYILKLGKDGSFAYYYWPELANGLEAFKLLRRLHGLKKEI